MHQNCFFKDYSTENDLKTAKIQIFDILNLCTDMISSSFMRSVFDLISIIITILIFVPITNQPAHNRLAENKPPAGLHYPNEYGNEDEKWEWFRDRILTYILQH